MIEVFQEQQGGVAEYDDGNGTPPPPKPELLNIKVKDANNNEIFFKCKPQTKFGKLFNAYCDQKGMQKNTVRFFFDNTRLLDEQCPADVSYDFCLPVFC